MKKPLLLVAGILLSGLLYSQTAVQDDGAVEVLYPSAFSKTLPLRELIEQTPQYQEIPDEMKPESPDRQNRTPFSEKLNPDALPLGDDPAAQRVMGTRVMTPPLVSWNGQNGTGVPPDPSGDAGPNHYVQAVNTTYRIYSKTGTAMTNSLSLGSLLFGVNHGDPIVMYDKFADRWFISQFNYSTNKVYIGLSETSDPMGAYNTWQYSCTELPDYLKFSIWQDGYYMTSNMGTQRIFVFERTEMIAGNSAARSISKTFSPPDGGGFFCPLSAYADGELPPAGTPCPIFTYEDDGWGAAYDDAINIYNATVNWAATPTLTVTLKQTLLTDPFDASYNASWNDIPQPSSTQKLDGIGGVFTFRAQWRSWTGYNTVVLNCGVKVSASQRSIRWYELRQDQSSGNWSIYQQSTYAPDAHYRWCGSIAMDDNGSIGLAYAKASSSVSASIGYTGRLATDPLNTMTFAEEIAATGSGAQAGHNRFGDYTHTALDPVDGTIFWHTGEYFSSGSPRTKIFSFQIPFNAGLEEDAVALPIIKAYTSDNSIVVNGSSLADNSELMVDLFDINGRLISSSKVTPSGNAFETSISVVGLVPGTYLVRVGKMYSAFQEVIKVAIQ